MNRNYSLPTDAFWTTGANHNGLSNKDKQHCILNVQTGERLSLVPLMDNAKVTKLKNPHIPPRVVKILNLTKKYSMVA